MSSNSVINFKVFLRNGDNLEARRFAVDASVVTSFLFMKEKLQSLIPQLKDAEYKITWKDADNDEITIMTDEDLITAYTEMNSSVKVLYVTVFRRGVNFVIDVEEPDLEPRHMGRVICDHCGRVITGIRFKCIQCADYDLCSDCEHQGSHTEHLMMRIPHNFLFPKCSRRNIHNLLRSFRKSCYFDREPHRGHAQGQKHCHKSEKFSNQHEDDGGRGEGSKPKEAEPRHGCPFTEGLDFSQLAQHIDPFIEAFTRPTQSNPSEGETNVDRFSEMIRSAINGVFSRAAENNNNNNTQAEENSENNNNKNNNNNIPMDVESSSTQSETAASVPPQNPPPANAEESDKRREPGWTFVSSEQTAALTNSPQQTTSNPTPILTINLDESITNGLAQLQEMGFSNENNRLTYLLRRFDGNVSKVVKTLIEMRL